MSNCPHTILRAIYGDEIIFGTPDFHRLQCRRCGKFLRGPASLGNSEVYDALSEIEIAALIAMDKEIMRYERETAAINRKVERTNAEVRELMKKTGITLSPRTKRWWQIWK